MSRSEAELSVQRTERKQGSESSRPHEECWGTNSELDGQIMRHSQAMVRRIDFISGALTEKQSASFTLNMKQNFTRLLHT